MVSRGVSIKRDYLTALVDVSYMIGKEEHVLYNLAREAGAGICGGGS